jgi:hypothetical protein
VCNYTPNADDDFVTNEIWDGTTNGAYFTEAGVFTGIALGGIYYSKTFFWADQRPNGGGYNEHAGLGTAGTQNYYSTKIVWAGNNTWDVYGGGGYTLLGQSTSQPLSSSGDLDAGTEYNMAESSGMRNVGGVYKLEYEDLQDNWHFWGNLGGNADSGSGRYITSTYYPSDSHVYWSGPC